MKNKLANVDNHRVTRLERLSTFANLFLIGFNLLPGFDRGCDATENLEDVEIMLMLGYMACCPSRLLMEEKNRLIKKLYKSVCCLLGCSCKALAPFFIPI